VTAVWVPENANLWKWVLKCKFLKSILPSSPCKLQNAWLWEKWHHAHACYAFSLGVECFWIPLKGNRLETWTMGNFGPELTTTETKSIFCLKSHMLNFSILNIGFGC